jgi:hypothetical protein
MRLDVNTRGMAVCDSGPVARRTVRKSARGRWAPTAEHEQLEIHESRRALRIGGVRLDDSLFDERAFAAARPPPWQRTRGVGSVLEAWRADAAKRRYFQSSVTRASHIRILNDIRVPGSMGDTPEHCPAPSCWEVSASDNRPEAGRGEKIWPRH